MNLNDGGSHNAFLDCATFTHAKRKRAGLEVNLSSIENPIRKYMMLSILQSQITTQNMKSMPSSQNMLVGVSYAFKRKSDCQRAGIKRKSPNVMTLSPDIILVASITEVTLINLQYPVHLLRLSSRREKERILFAVHRENIGKPGRMSSASLPRV